MIETSEDVRVPDWMAEPQDDGKFNRAGVVERLITAGEALSLYIEKGRNDRWPHDLLCTCASALVRGNLCTAFRHAVP